MGVALSASIVFPVLYLLTRTWAFSYDALTAALTAERNGVFPFHPNHLFGTGLGWAFFKGMIFAGKPTSALLVFQTVNAVVAGLAIGYFFYLLAEHFSMRAGILGAAGLGLSYAFWSEAVDAGAYASTGLMAIVLTGKLLRLSQNSHPRGPRKEKNNNAPLFSVGQSSPLFLSGQISPLWIGLCVGAGILVHQMFLLSIPSFVILFLWSARQNNRSLLYFFLGIFLFGLLPYGLIAHYYYGYGPREGLYWFFGPAGPRPNSGIISNSWWQWNVFQNMIPLWQGLVRSLMAPLPTRLSWANFPIQLFLAMGIFTLFLGSLRLFFRTPQQRPILCAVLAWIVAMNIFQFFWVPGTIRFRILFLPVLIVGGVIALGGLPEMAQKWVKKSTALFLFLILGIGFSNAVGTISPAARIENNRDIVRSLWVRQTMGPNDFFLFAGRGDSIMNVVPPYFSPRVPSRSLYGYFFANPSGDFSEMGRIIAQTFSQGGNVYIEEQLFTKEAWFGLAQDEPTAIQILSKWFSQYETQSLLNGPSGYRVVKIHLLTQN